MWHMSKLINVARAASSAKITTIKYANKHKKLFKKKKNAIIVITSPEEKRPKTPWALLWHL